MSAAPNPTDALEVVSRLIRLAKDESELFIHFEQDQAWIVEPRTRRWVENRRRALGVTRRSWRAEVETSRQAELDDAAELEAFWKSTDAGETRAHSKPPPPAAEVLESVTRSEWAPTPLELLEAFDPSVVYQAVLIHRTLGWSILASTSGTRVMQTFSRNEALVRAESPIGALVEGECASVLPDLRPMMARLGSGLRSLEETGAGIDRSLPVVFGPRVAAPFVMGLSVLLRGDVAQKSSGLGRMMGKKIFPSVLTVLDEAGAGDAIQRGRDDEGQPIQPLRLVDGGTLSAFAHSAETATAMGHPLNGHAQRPSGRGSPSTGLWNLRIAGGSTPLPADRNELDVRIETFNPLPKPNRVGITVAGAIVRDHRRVAPIAPFDVELPVLETLRKVTGVGADLRFFPALEHCGSPTLIFPNMP